MINIFEDFACYDDSSYPFLLGGSKARKLKAIIEDAKLKGTNAIVSAGAATSNHARDCALVCARLGWKCKLIIHDDEDYDKANLFLMRLAGAELVFCHLSDVAQQMDQAMHELKEDGYTPYYIWGGGHSVHATKALYDAVSDFQACSNGFKPNYVLVASGTGGTHAGLHCGFNHLYPDTKVIGVSVARNRSRGQAAVELAVREMVSTFGLKGCDTQVDFRDDWIGTGYGSSSPRIGQIIQKYAKRGLLLDPVYTAKVMMAFEDMKMSGAISNADEVLFWHTGGIFNLIDAKHLLGVQ